MTSSGSFPSKARHCDTANSQLPGLMASDLKAVIILKLEDNKFSIKYTLSFLPVFSSHFRDSLSRFFPVKFLNCKAGCKDVSLNQRLLTLPRDHCVRRTTILPVFFFFYQKYICLSPIEKIIYLITKMCDVG